MATIIERNWGRITKRLLLAGAIAIVLAALLALFYTPSAKASSIEVYSDKQPVSFTIDPIVQEGTTLVQLRPLFESLGIELTWNNKTKTVVGKKGELTFSLPVGSKTAQINGKNLTLLKPAQIIDGHTVVPLRFVGEATGAAVGWNDKKRVISIYSSEYMEILDLTKQQALVEVNEAVFTEHSPHPSGINGLYGFSKADLLNNSGCNGVCWDFYYFLNDTQLVVQRPERGWEATDCKVDKCLTYEIKDDTLMLSSGVKRSLKLLKGSSIVIGGDTYTHYEPYQHLKLSGKYVSSSYTTNWSGIGMASTNEIFFHPDGTFSDDSWLGVLTDGSDSGDGSGISHTLTSKSEKAGTYAIINHTLLLKYKDGTTEQRMFLLPDKDFDFMRIGGRDFFFVETSFEPYKDKLTTDKIAEKNIFSEWTPEKQEELQDISITLDGYQWAELTINEKHRASFDGFEGGNIVGLTVKYTIKNDSDRNVNIDSLQAELFVNSRSGKILETAALVPAAKGELKPGEHVERMAVYLMPTSKFKEFYDFHLIFSGLKDTNGQEVFGNASLRFNIWND